jgi:hypothetical protein
LLFGICSFAFVLKDPLENIIDLLERVREVEAIVDFFIAQGGADVLIIFQT